MRVELERLVSTVVVLVTVLTLVLLGVYGVMKLAVGDIHAQTASARGEIPAPSLSPVAAPLSALLTSDLATADLTGLDARALELDHRSDRLLEMTAVVALLGMLTALFTGPPGRANEEDPLRRSLRSIEGPAAAPATVDRPVYGGDGSR